MSGERAPWRHQAEVECMKSGSVKIGTGVVQIDPIEGPGMCGTDFPLKVAALGRKQSACRLCRRCRVRPGQFRRLGADAALAHQPAAIRAARANPFRAGVGAASERHECAGYLDRRRPSNLAILRRPDNRFRSARRVSHPLKRVLLRRRSATLPDDIPDDAALPPSRTTPTYAPRTYGAPVYQPQPRSYDTPVNQQRSYEAPVYQPPQRACRRSALHAGPNNWY